jgi:uncharacterized protein YprB with RNaseH-like and TPR domain
LLTYSFIHLPGVGEQRESVLWRSGVKNWQDFLDQKPHKQPRFNRLSPWVEESIQRLEKRDAQFFYSNLPTAQRWRLYDAFRENCAFLDIETTGLLNAGVITVAGLFNGKELKTFIRGQNLRQFVSEIKQYSLVVTFGGSCFDIPFIKKEFNVADPCSAHIDLRYVLHRLGHGGGLKQIERKFGLSREGPIGKVDGWLAPALWMEYKRGRSEALEALIRYNAEDIVNLRTLMEKSFALYLKKVPLEIPFVETPKSHIKVPDYDPSYLKRFLRRHSLDYS